MSGMRFGILGIGGIARSAHAPALRDAPGAVLWSVCGRDAERAVAFAGEFGAASPRPAYADIEAFLADPQLDAVIVATPDDLHAAQAIAALEAGKHVLVEKPLAVASSDVVPLSSLAWQKGRRVAVAYHLRHHAGHRRLREEILRGAVGSVGGIHVSWSTQSMAADCWRARPENRPRWVLAALGTHAVDLAWWLSGSKVLEEGIQAVRDDSRSGYSDERQRVTLSVPLESGAVASIYVSVTDAPTKCVRIVGSKGVVECRNTLGGRGTGEIVMPDGSLLPYVHVNPYVAQITAFVREDPVMANANDGWEHVRWLEAAERSMDETRRAICGQGVTRDRVV